MLDPSFVRDHADLVRAALTNRGADADALLSVLTPLDEKRRSLIPQVETLKRDQNAAAEEVAKRKKAGEDVAGLVDANRRAGSRSRSSTRQLQNLEEERRRLLLTIPNVPHATVPVGRSADDNTEVRRVGEPRGFDFEPKAHWDLGPALGILDFERGTKIAGARFTVLMRDGAKLARALINFMLDLHTRQHGYTEVEPPFLANSASLTGTGNLPKFEQDLFKIAGEWDLYLVPTAEVPLTNLYRGEILDGRSLPLRFTAYTPCFRSEAGSYGADVRGLIRQHQFDKVELVKFAAPEQSLRRAGTADARMPRACSSCSNCLTGRCCSQRATWGSRRRRPTTSRSGCRARRRIERFRRAATPRRFRPVARISSTAPAGAARPTSCTP